MRFYLYSHYIQCINECADWIKRSIKYKVTHTGTMSKLLPPSVNVIVKTYVCFAGEVSKPAPSPHHSRRSASRRHRDGILPASSDSKLPVSGCFRLVKFPQICPSDRDLHRFSDVFISKECRVSIFLSFFEHPETMK